MQKQDHFDRPPGPMGGSLWYLAPVRTIKREPADDLVKEQGVGAAA